MVAKHQHSDLGLNKDGNKVKKISYNTKYVYLWKYDKGQEWRYLIICWLVIIPAEEKYINNGYERNGYLNLLKQHIGLVIYEMLKE